MRCLALLVLLVVAACADTGASAPKEYAVPDRLLGYTYAGGTIRPIPRPASCATRHCSRHTDWRRFSRGQAESQVASTRPVSDTIVPVHVPPSIPSSFGTWIDPGRTDNELWRAAVAEADRLEAVQPCKGWQKRRERCA
jgi:hypothetical protein